MNSSIAKSFLSLSNEDQERLHIKMKTVYHVIKNRDLYTNYPKLLKLQTKNGVSQLLKSKTQASYATDDTGAIIGNFIGCYNVDLLKKTKDKHKINYFFELTDGSTDASVTEQEAIYILFLNNGVPIVRYFSIEKCKKCKCCWDTQKYPNCI